MNRASRFFMTLCLVGFACTTAAWADFTDGLQAAQQGDYATAIAEWQPLAAAGDTAAQANLGILYEQGLGVPVDLSEAATWYEKAATGGNLESQFHLGMMYALGQGVPQDYAAAATWFEKAAARGDARAQYNLGILLADGLGRSPTLSQAATWFQKAAEQGYADAKYRYAIMLLAGHITAQNPDVLETYLADAAKAGIADAQFRYGQLLIKGTSEISQNTKAGLSWLERSAAQNYIPAIVELGLVYYQGQGLPPDFGKAYDLFKTAADAGRPSAQFNLCLMAKNGQGIPQDYVQAHFWCNVAAAGFQAGPERDMATQLRDEIADNLSNKSLEKAQDLAKAWWEKH